MQPWRNIPKTYAHFYLFTIFRVFLNFCNVNMAPSSFLLYIVLYFIQISIWQCIVVMNYPCSYINFDNFFLIILHFAGWWDFTKIPHPSLMIGENEIPILWNSILLFPCKWVLSHKSNRPCIYAQKWMINYTIVH